MTVLLDHHPIGEIEFLPGHIIRVALIGPIGLPRLDIRWWRVGADGSCVPTATGFTLAPDQVCVLSGLLRDAERYVIEEAHSVDATDAEN